MQSCTLLFLPWSGTCTSTVASPLSLILYSFDVSCLLLCIRIVKPLSSLRLPLFLGNSKISHYHYVWNSPEVALDRSNPQLRLQGRSEALEIISECRKWNSVHLLRTLTFEPQTNLISYLYCGSFLDHRLTTLTASCSSYCWSSHHIALRCLSTRYWPDISLQCHDLTI